LGEVKNGESVVGNIGFDQFMVFITAEASPDVRERVGKLVLRGMSSSARMRPLDLLLMKAEDRESHDHHDMSKMGMDHATLAWSMPPMDSLLPTTPWLGDSTPDTP